MQLNNCIIVPSDLYTLADKIYFEQMKPKLFTKSLDFTVSHTTSVMTEMQLVSMF